MHCVLAKFWLPFLLFIGLGALQMQARVPLVEAQKTLHDLKEEKEARKAEVAALRQLCSRWISMVYALHQEREQVGISPAARQPIEDQLCFAGGRVRRLLARVHHAEEALAETRFWYRRLRTAVRTQEIQAKQRRRTA